MDHHRVCNACVDAHPHPQATKQRELRAAVGNGIDGLLCQRGALSLAAGCQPLGRRWFPTCSLIHFVEKAVEEASAGLYIGEQLLVLAEVSRRPATQVVESG